MLRLRLRVQASGLAARPPLRPPLPHHLHHRHHHLDRRVAAVVYLPLLLVRDGAGGTGDRARQGPDPRHAVVHPADPLLVAYFDLTPLFF